MKTGRVFVVVPALDSSGPVKGAVALCNSLVDHLPVALVFLKPSKPLDLNVRPAVEICSLADKRSWSAKRAAYRDVLRRSGGRDRVASISYCMSADALNSSMGKNATIISSVRGNLSQNYRFDYGFPGILLARTHYLLLRRFDKVVAMSRTMARQLGRLGISQTVVIGNFVDEVELERYRMAVERKPGLTRFLFLGSLTRRKRPELVIEAVHELRLRGFRCRLDVIGDGPLRSTLAQRPDDGPSQPPVTFHGQLDNPYELLQRAHYMVLPSESEGISRAVLEALFFGVPCIMRDIDANRDVVSVGRNGELFSNDNELVDAMARAIDAGVAVGDRPESLLPRAFRQQPNVDRFLEVLAGHDSD